MNEKPNQYSKIGWCLIAAVSIVIIYYLPVIAVEIGSGLMIIFEFISVLVILGISGWHLLRRHE